MNLLHANDTAGHYPPSFYAATATPLAPFAALQGDTRADVCVIGGGYTGNIADHAFHFIDAADRRAHV